MKTLMNLYFYLFDREYRKLYREAKKALADLREMEDGY